MTHRNPYRKRVRIEVQRHVAHYSATIYNGIDWVTMSTGPTVAAAVGNAVASYRRRMRAKRDAAPPRPKRPRKLRP